MESAQFNSEEVMCWSINEVMIESDTLERENNGRMTPEVYLTRLNYDQRIGRSVDLSVVAELRSKLRILPTRNIGRVFLSEPFGVYYTQLTCPYPLYHKESTQKLWDQHPIETAEISFIPADATSIESDRLKRAKVVRLHFNRGTLENVLKVVEGLPLNCTTLHLVNVKVYQFSQVDLFSKVKPVCPKLKSIRYNFR